MKKKIILLASLIPIALTGCLKEPTSSARELQPIELWVEEDAMLVAKPERDPARPRSLFYEPLTDREKYGTGIDMFKRNLQGIGLGNADNVIKQLEDHDIKLSEGAKSAMQAKIAGGAQAVKAMQNDPAVTQDGRKVMDNGLLEPPKAPSKVYRNKCTADDNLLQVSWYKVIDGDTVKVFDFNDNSYKVKLQGIDAPELKQGFGKQAKKALHQCLAYDPTENIIVEWRDKDKDGNIVGKVSNAQFEDCGLFLVELGLAWHDKNNEFNQYEHDRFLYSNAEVVARRMVNGLWVDKNNIAPWDYKDGKKKFTTDFQTKAFDYKKASCTLAGGSTKVVS